MPFVQFDKQLENLCSNEIEIPDELHNKVPMSGTQWALYVGSLADGKVQKAFAAMGEDQTGNYDALKAAILKQYNVNKEAYQQRLRGVVRRSDELYKKLATRVRNLHRSGWRRIRQLVRWWKQWQRNNCWR